MKNLLPKYFLSLFTLAIILVWVQQWLGPIKLAGLQGAYDPGNWPALTKSSWFSGSYQARADHYLKHHTAFNGELVRLRNQTDYVFFGSINTMLVLGKDHYLFDPSYIDAREGKDLANDRVVGESANMLHFFRSKFSTPLLFIFVPNKADFYSEYLPQPSIPAEVTNRIQYQKLLQQSAIPYIDFDKWFLSVKDTSEWPLVPKYGAHWSTLGAAYAGDSLIKKLNWLLGADVSDYRITGIDTTSDARFQDDDYLPSLNLMTRWKSPVLAYPDLQFRDGNKPNLLFISDSFIWNFYDIGMMQNCFDQKSHVVYYNQTIFDMQRNNLGPADKISSENLLENRDAIVIITSDPSLKDFAFGFLKLQLNK